MSKKKKSLLQKVKCDSCRGVGSYREKGETFMCLPCFGKGFNTTLCSLRMKGDKLVKEEIQEVKCPVCDGDGFDVVDRGLMGDEEVTCDFCKGKGYIKVMVEVNY